MKTLLSVKDLSDRWDYSETKIREMVTEGKLKRWEFDEKSIRFSLAYIEKLEKLDDKDRMSPFERKKLELEIERLNKENERFKGIISKVLTNVSEAINF